MCEDKRVTTCLQIMLVAENIAVMGHTCTQFTFIMGKETCTCAIKTSV